jgi:8-oxo-dGTP pyrophosphatase MutT (NUDIX family)
MPKLVCRVGHQPKKYRYTDFRFERRGFLSIFSFAASDKKHRQEIMERGHAAVIMPVDFEKKEIYFVRQPRHVKAFTETAPGRRLVKARQDRPTASFEVPASRSLTLELPAGVIDPGETAAQAAIRELREETGLIIRPAALTKIARFYVTLGCCTETIVGFLARIDGRTKRTKACGDGDESVAVWKYTWDEAFRLAQTGKIESASSLVLLSHLMRFQEKKK